MKLIWDSKDTCWSCTLKEDGNQSDYFGFNSHIPHCGVCVSFHCPESTVWVICISMYPPYRHNLLHRTEVGHCGSCFDVLYDVVFFQQLIRTFACDILISPTTEELLSGWCQDQREDIIRVTLIREFTINSETEENDTQGRLEVMLWRQ